MSTGRRPVLETGGCEFESHHSDQFVLVKKKALVGENLGDKLHSDNSAMNWRFFKVTCFIEYYYEGKNVV